MMQKFTCLFRQPKPIIGVIHVGALPGTPAQHFSIPELVETARNEARLYREGGVDGVILENMHDTPYLRGSVGPEIVAAMTVLAEAIKAEFRGRVGIQILAGANCEALAVAHAAQLDFVRVEGFAFAHVADEGIIESSAAKLLRYRKQIGANHIQIWADIKKKHAAHAITADVNLGETAEAAEFMRASAVIVTGSATGKAPRLSDVQEAQTHCRLPVLLGSGIDDRNLDTFFPFADGFIIGSFFKTEGRWEQPVDLERVQLLVEKAQSFRSVI